MKELRICEIRAAGTAEPDGLIIEGVPIVYDTPTVINDPAGSYTEIIRRGALDNADISDTRLLYNHDLNKVPLARTPKTMQLEKSPAGLKMVAYLPDTEEARSVHTAVVRGDLSGASFAFKVPKGGDRWNGRTREILKIEKVYEISVVPFPAYPQASIEARTALQKIIEKKENKVMNFSTVQEAFNHYRTATAAEIETRAAEIKNAIQTDPAADIEAFNIELDGLREARANLQDRQTETRAQFNPVTSMAFESRQTVSDSDIFGSREYRSAFHKTMLNQSLNTEEAAIFQRANQLAATEKRAAFINTGEAAAVIPTQMLNEIYKMASDMGGILPLVRRFDIPANLAVPVATPEDAAEWHIEGAEVTPTNKKPTNIIFNGYELMKVFSISAAARTMSLTAFESYLQQELSRVMVTALEKAVISGTGTGQPKGLLADSVITNELLDQKAEYKTFTKVAAMLKRGYAMGAAWAMNNATLYDGVMGIMDTTGRPLFNEARDGNANRILGYPIAIDDFIPDSTIIFGNFQYYGMNYPQNIMLEVSRDSSFRKGLIDYRAMAIADGKPIIGEAFIKLTLEA